MMSKIAESNRPMRSQRVDPWIVLWPMLATCLGGAGFFLSATIAAIVAPAYLEGRSDSIDLIVLVALGPVYSRLVPIAVALVGIVVGYMVYKTLTRGTYSSDRKVKTISSALAWVSIIWLVVQYAFYYILGYPFAFAGSLSRVMADAILALSGSVMMVLGVGYLRDYHEFAAAARLTGSRVGVFVVRKSETPSLVEKATSPIGGSFYMLLDPRVKRIELHMVPVVLNHQVERPKSPDEVRREQRLTW